MPLSRPDLTLLSLPGFRRLLIMRVFITMALQSQAVIVGWQVYDITKDPLMLGLIGLAEAIPALICALFSGHVVDHNPAHRTYLFSTLALALNVALLWAVGGGVLPVSTHTVLYALFAGVFMSGLARAFTMPSAFTLLPLYVPRDKLAAASAWLNGGFQTAAISGPAIAGLVYGFMGPMAAWTLPLVLLVLALCVAFGLEAVTPARPKGKEPAWASIKAGWAYILKSPIILSVMTLDMFAVLFGGAVAMLPAYADQILHVGPEGLGALRAAPAVGAVITALYFALKPLKVLSGVHLMTMFVGFGLCMIGFGLSTVFGLSLVFLALSGAFDCVNVIIRSTILQLLTPEAMRGRVSAVNSMFVISSNEIGAFQSGVAARVLGLVPSVVFGGMMCLGVVAVVALLSPKLRGLRMNAGGS